MKLKKCLSIRLAVLMVLVGITMTLCISSRQFESHSKKLAPQIVESVKSITSTDSYNSNSGCSPGQTYNEVSRKCELDDNLKNMRTLQKMVAPKIVENLGVFKNQEKDQDKGNTSWVSVK